MADYVIMTDSCCDLSAEMAAELGLEVLPLRMEMAGKEYRNFLDGREIGCREFYGRVRGGEMPVTSAVNVWEFDAAMRPILEAGEDIRDFVGPLGQPTEIPEGTKRVCVIGGGVGCAIAYPQAKALHAQGVAVDVIVGFRSRDLVILEEEFRAVSDRFFLMTDDGSAGEQGLVTQKLQERIEGGANYDLVIAIGPIPMMKFVCKGTEPYGIKTLVSLNPLMIDGTGMCGCCRVTVGGQVRFACVDGPDFDGHQVDFEELMARNGTYRAQEEQARADHVCRMDRLGRHLIP